MDDDSKAPFSPSIMLPVVSVGAIFLAILSLAFCCYLMRLKRHTKKVRGYKKVIVNKKSKDTCLEMMKTDTCAICLDDFKNKQVLAVCPCAHVFHKKCLVKWLRNRPTCPMCMAQVNVAGHESYPYTSRINNPVHFNQNHVISQPPMYAASQV